MPELFTNRMNVNNFSAWIGRVIYKLIGWRVEGEFPRFPKSVVIVAHHTSNWDFAVGYPASLIYRIKGYWVGKHTLFKKPFGSLMRWLGGIPLDRTSSKNFVDQVIQTFDKHKELLLVIAPEGTRKRVDKWKTGFYYIAKGAKVPIICAFLDYKRKVAGFGLVIKPSDDEEGDMNKIREFYKSITAKLPENTGDIIIFPKTSHS